MLTDPGAVPRNATPLPLPSDDDGDGDDEEARAGRGSGGSAAAAAEEEEAEDSMAETSRLTAATSSSSSSPAAAALRGPGAPPNGLLPPEVGIGAGRGGVQRRGRAAVGAAATAGVERRVVKWCHK